MINFPTTYCGYSVEEASKSWARTVAERAKNIAEMFDTPRVVVAVRGPDSLRDFKISPEEALTLSVEDIERRVLAQWPDWA